MTREWQDVLGNMGQSNLEKEGKETLHEMVLSNTSAYYTDNFILPPGFLQHCNLIATSYMIASSIQQYNGASCIRQE